MRFLMCQQTFHGDYLPSRVCKYFCNHRNLTTLNGFCYIVCKETCFIINCTKRRVQYMTFIISTFERCESAPNIVYIQIQLLKYILNFALIFTNTFLALYLI